MIFVEKLNDVHYKLHCEESIAYELNDFFSFYAKNYKHMPKYRAGIWDGKIRLFSLQTRTMYAGLLEKLVYFCNTREYELKVDDSIHQDLKQSEFKEFTLKSLVEYLKPPFIPHDYQVEYINIMLSKKRRLLLSPTSSGKSFIIYGATRYLVDQSKKILIVVPTTTLVEQIVKDFDSYGWDGEKYCHKIYSGKEKTTNQPVVVSTWQSIYKMPKKWFSGFNAVIVDEAHLAQAESIKGIMEKMVECEYRIGLTGTIEDTQTHKLVLQGLFGKISRLVDTKDLMERGIVAELMIKGIVIKHKPEDCKIVSKMKYQDEITTVVGNEKRNKFICKLALSQSGNTLVLFNYVVKHGVPLFKMMNSMNDKNEKKIFFVHGDTSTETREEIRAITEKHNNVIIIASYGTFSTGINIKNLDNAIFAHPYKAKIKILQSIGRVLRKAKEDSKAFLFDIVDNYSWGSKVNMTYQHFKSRIAIYEKEQFKYKIMELEV